jgi:selenocysteine lyase/cysteine desulfurase
MSTTAPLLCQKAQFSIPQGVHYLNCAYMAPAARAVQEAGHRAIERSAAPLDIRPHHFFDAANRARQLFAQLIGAAQPERVAIIPAVSYGIAITARNTRLRPQQQIVMTEEQFPSNVYAWRRLAKQTGARIRAVGAPVCARRADVWNEALLAAIDESTAIVTLPQVHWTDGTRFDLERIGARARELGAAFIIDATQSVGAHPFDALRMNADAVVCAGYKWLMGPYGLGLVWLGPRYDDAEPLEENWIGRVGSEDFQQLVNYRDEYQPGAARFDVGERSNFVLLPMLVAALEMVTQWQPERVQQYCTSLAQDVLEAARDLGFTVADTDQHGAHLFGLRVPAGLDLRVLHRALEERSVFASLRGSALRIAPHVYNDAADMTALHDALQASVSGGISAAAPSTAGAAAAPGR